MPDRYTFHNYDTHGVVVDTQTGEATRYDLVSDAEAAARRLNDQNRRPAMASEVDTSAARKLANVLIDDVNCGPNARYQPYTDGRMRDAAKMIRALAAERDAAVEAAVQAERADCARHIDARVAGWRNAENPEDETVNGYLAFAGQLLSHEIRARGPADALAAALAKAREDALRECEAVAMACQQENIDLGLSDMAAGSGEVVAAIRALAGKEQGK